MSRKSLVVGIDYYNHTTGLRGCVSDARSIASMLQRHADGRPNFASKLLVSDCDTNAVSRKTLRVSIRELFSGSGDLALFYFAGHGYLEDIGGYILASDSKNGEDGIALTELLSLANRSEFLNRIIILDSCHSGIAGILEGTGRCELSEGTTILTATGAEQYAQEHDDGGLFTALLLDALDGAASNLIGQITPGAVYAHIDQSLGPWGQRPVFKTNVSRFVSIRNSDPPVSLPELRRISELFPVADHLFALNPSFEPESGQADQLNVEVFGILQKYNRVNLVTPVGAFHMYHAAMNSTACRLTTLGEHYRRLSSRGMF